MSELNRKKPGKEFDLAYLAGQMQDHQQTANLLLYEISFGQNGQLTKYAAEMLPGVLDHLDALKRQHAALTFTAPRQ